MNYCDFVLAAEAHLRTKGWRRAGHNGTWPTLRCGGEHLAYPLPAAILKDLDATCAFQPTVEAYLLAHGWLRLKSVVCLGQPMFQLGVLRGMRAAMLEQLKNHRLDRYTPPNELRAVHSVGSDRPPAH